MENRIIAISDINVQIFFEDPSRVKIGDVLRCICGKNEYKFEVVEVNNNLATTIPLNSVVGLIRGIEVEKIADGLEIPTTT